MQHDDLNLSDFEHSRTTGRIAAAILVVGGLGLCLPLVLGVLGADEGVYTAHQRTRLIAIGVPAILITFGFFAAVALTAGKRVSVDFEEGVVATESRVLGFRRRKALPLSSDGKVVHREIDVPAGKH